MDAETFARIYDSHYPRVFRYLLGRIRGRHEAEELTAEVFAAALEGLQRGRQPRHIGNWLVGIADHLASRFWRKRAVERDFDGDTAVIDVRDPEDVTMRQLDTEVLWRCLGALEPEHRQVLLLRIVAELPARQVGIIMGRSEEAVRSLQLRALRALRRHWTEANGS